MMPLKGKFRNQRALSTVITRCSRAFNGFSENWIRIFLIIQCFSLLLSMVVLLTMLLLGIQMAFPDALG